ncbi:MAG: ABC transporter permease [Actinomycetia bacterium]|nr:ABC transporter permease [Actinomycetes bacterium]
MKLINIALKDVKIVFRDKMALLILLAMPFILMTIMGMALGGLFSKGPELSKIDVAVVNYDDGKVSEDFIEEILKGDELSKLLNVKEMDKKRAMNLVRIGDISSVIIIPSDFTSQIMKNKSTEMKVYGDPGQEIRASIVRSITNAYTNKVSSVMVGVRTGWESLTKLGKKTNLTEIARYIPFMINEMIEKDVEDLVKIEEENTSQKESLSSMQYYAAGMSTMFVLFSAMFGADSILKERDDKTLARLLSSPMKKHSVLGGKLLGIFIIGILQFTAYITATKLIFNVNWGRSIIGLVLLPISTVLATTGMTIFFASIAKTRNAVGGISQIFIQSMSALGGSMFPTSLLPPWLRFFSNFTINKWSMDGFLSLMSGAGVISISKSIIVLLAIALVFFILGIWRFSYE